MHGGRKAMQPAASVSWVRRFVERQLFGVWEVNYREPRGDPGLFGPGSVTWQVHSNPVALAVGGVAAVILELAEPRVRAGVWDHTSFRTDPLGRMRRTAEATMLTTYAPSEAAKQRIALVNRIHQRITGITPDGTPYHAMDPELLLWVQATAVYGFLNAYLRFVEPLSGTDQDRYYAEGAAVGCLFGAAKAPGSVAEVEAVFAAMRPKLRPDPVIHEFLGVVSRTSPIGGAGRPLQELLVQASVDLLPDWARWELRLPYRPLLSAVAGSAMRAMAFAAKAVPGGIVEQARDRAGANCHVSELT
ncbi:MAG TPA: oxygenase MpaB family protein [Afifellaceae bacterium]|nr:oxygenase MpaB family protein [Afifellaceae bacterium]